MPLNQQALGTLNAQQQQQVQQALGISRQQRQQQNLMGSWQAYQQAVQNLAGGTPPGGTPPAGAAPPAPAAPPVAAGSVVSGNPRAMYRQMGGQSGTGMDFKKFKQWYRGQTGGLGMDLNQYLEMAGLGLSSSGVTEQTVGPGSTQITAGSDVVNRTNPEVLSDAAELHLLNRKRQQAGLETFGSLAEAQEAMALAAGFAGVEQFNVNMGGGQTEGATRGNLPGFLQNASMQDIRYNPESWNLLFETLMQSDDPAKLMEQRQGLVPEWATEVDKALRGTRDINRDTQGIPFGFELLSDPSINYSDPSKPLWGGDYPASLQGLHHNQAGEGDVLRSTSAAEMMQHLWPLLHAQTHQQPGQAAPFEAGLSFGSPVLGANGRYTRSPMMGYNDETTMDPDAMELWGIEPGQTYGKADLTGRLAGGIYPRFQAWSQWQNPAETFAGPFAEQGQGAAMNDYYENLWRNQFWQLPENSPFRTLPPEIMQRLLAVIGNPVGAGAASTLNPMGA